MLHTLIRVLGNCWTIRRITKYAITPVSIASLIIYNLNPSESISGNRKLPEKRLFQSLTFFW